MSHAKKHSKGVIAYPIVKHDPDADIHWTDELVAWSERKGWPIEEVVARSHVSPGWVQVAVRVGKRVPA